MDYAKEGFTAALEGNLCVILDTTITAELEEEGLARELISKVQQMRKNKDFEMMDRINVFVDADEAVSAAIKAFEAYICGEVLADTITVKTGLDTFDLNGHKTGIDVEKVE